MIILAAIVFRGQFFDCQVFVNIMLLNTAAQNSLALKQIWETIDTDSCPGNYNFHMHTVCSDGQLTPEQLMAQAVQIGLKAMAITDHHSVCGYHAAQHWLENIPSELPSTSLPHLWTGVEVTAQLLRTKGFKPEHRAMDPYLQGQ